MSATGGPPTAGGPLVGCAAITPNRLEAGLATGRVLETTGEALEAAAELRERLDLEAAVVTLDRDGMALAHRDGRRAVFPTRPQTTFAVFTQPLRFYVPSLMPLKVAVFPSAANPTTSCSVAISGYVTTP